MPTAGNHTAVSDEENVVFHPAGLMERPDATQRGGEGGGGGGGRLSCGSHLSLDQTLEVIFSYV